MRKGLQKVMDGEVKRCGNYHYEYNSETDVTEVFYHTTCICAYSDKLKIFFADHRGFYTTSTSQAVNGARHWCEYRGYTEVTVDEFKEKTGAECKVGGWA